MTRADMLLKYKRWVRSTKRSDVEDAWQDWLKRHNIDPSDVPADLGMIEVYGVDNLFHVKVPILVKRDGRFQIGITAEGTLVAGVEQKVIATRWLPGDIEIEA